MAPNVRAGANPVPDLTARHLADLALERAVFAWKPDQPNPFDAVGPDVRVRVLTRVRWRYAYEVYLRSSAWQRIRRAALVRASGRCEHCRRAGLLLVLEVHHWTYEHLGDERPDELEAMCGDCHAQADRERRSRLRPWWSAV